jgi:hypothetical protein
MYDFKTKYGFDFRFVKPKTGQTATPALTGLSTGFRMAACQESDYLFHRSI